MGTKKANHRVKYRFSCLGPNHLTTYNEQWNESVRKKCKQTTIFQPHLSCQGCEYLETKRL